MIQLMREDDQFDVRDTDLGVPNGDAETVYTLRPLTRDTVKEILGRHQRQQANPRTQQMETVFVTGGQEKSNEDMLDYVLVDWTGILCGGVPVPCEREHKLKLDALRMFALIDQAGLSQKVGSHVS